jgi:hypothetical protein
MTNLAMTNLPAGATSYTLLPIHRPTENTGTARVRTGPASAPDRCFRCFLQGKYSEGRRVPGAAASRERSHPIAAGKDAFRGNCDSNKRHLEWQQTLQRAAALLGRQLRLELV